MTFEKNVVQCEKLHTGGTRIGLTLGQPTSPDAICENLHCIPACVDCVMRNDITFACPVGPCGFVQWAPGAR
jgi:hypothetical protein